MTREETLEAFVCCAQTRTVCKNCPLKGPIGEQGMKCKSELITSVCHWLMVQEQEPKAMTLSGVRNLKESTPVWLEDVDKKDVIGALFMRDYSGTKCVDFAIVRDWEFERVVADYMDYGVRWRCWTSRPTDEQRQNTPWKEV